MFVSPSHGNQSWIVCYYPDNAEQMSIKNKKAKEIRCKVPMTRDEDSSFDEETTA